MSLLFSKDQIMLVNRRLAVLVGLNEAIVLQQLHYWLGKKSAGIEHKGVRWVFNSLEKWHEQFPFWSETTIKRGLSDLRARKLIRVEKLSMLGRDRTNYYTIDYAQVALLEAQGATPSGQIDPMHRAKSTSCIGSDCTDPLSQCDPIDQASLTPSIGPICPNANKTKTSAKTTAETTSILPAKPAASTGGDETGEDEADDGKLPEPMEVIDNNGAVYLIPGELRYPKQGRTTHRAWVAYAIAYQSRYQDWPIWNATVGGQIARFIKRVGEDRAPRVAAFYVLKVNEQFVTVKRHGVAQLLGDAEKWASQSNTGSSMTSTRARQLDQTSANASVADEAMELIRKRRAAAATAAETGGQHAQ